MKKENVRKLLNLIKELPGKSFDMSWYGQTDKEGETPKQAITNRCGTVGCLAGWALLLALPPKKKLKRRSLEILGAHVKGRRFLGLKPRQADALFYGSWQSGYQKFACGENGKALAIEQLNYMLKTGKVNDDC